MENDKNDYRNNIIEVINTLLECDSMIFGAGINVLMSGELKEINGVLDIGDSYEFNVNHFETSTDSNIQLITGILKKIRSTVFSLQNLNLIRDEEIGWN